MPQEIINQLDVSELKEYPTQAFMAWGWNEGCAALLHVNYPNGGASVALEWGDLERLNRMVRRAMKAYRKRPLGTASALPMPEGEHADSRFAQAMT